MHICLPKFVLDNHVMRSSCLLIKKNSCLLLSVIKVVFNVSQCPCNIIFRGPLGPLMILILAHPRRFQPIRNTEKIALIWVCLNMKFSLVKNQTVNTNLLFSLLLMKSWVITRVPDCPFHSLKRTVIPMVFSLAHSLSGEVQVNYSNFTYKHAIYRSSSSWEYALHKVSTWKLCFWSNMRWYIRDLNYRVFIP